jgi:hypothetical protein
VCVIVCEIACREDKIEGGLRLRGKEKSSDDTRRCTRQGVCACEAARGETEKVDLQHVRRFVYLCTCPPQLTPGRFCTK